MNIWKRLRYKINIPTNEIANLLYIPEEKYIEIENGVRQMPKRLIDNFMKLYHERKDIKSETQIKMFEVNQFFKDMDLLELRKEFNYDTNEKLAKAIGIGVCSIYKVKSDLNSLSDNIKIKIYNFFNDPLNININKSQDIVKIKKDKTKKHTIEDSKKLVNKILKEQNLSQTELSKKIGVVSSVVSNWARGNHGISIDNYNKLKELDKPDVELNSVNDVNINISDIMCEKEPVKDDNEGLVNLKSLVDELNAENIRLRKTISRYEKLIDRL